MSFFKDLGNKIGEVAGDAAEKAKDMAEVTKIKMDISAEEKKIQQAFIELGKLYYDQVKDQEESPGAEQSAVIKASELAIADLESKIEAIKNV
ncbi:hypothetical protein MASR2M70_15580 [Bacillota bacterium]